eukprot:14467431-Heterocapsa_arctica.AAC.1
MEHQGEGDFDASGEPLGAEDDCGHCPHATTRGQCVDLHGCWHHHEACQFSKENGSLRDEGPMPLPHARVYMLMASSVWADGASPMARKCSCLARD